MADHLLEAMHATLTSPWLYVILLVLAWLDGFAPIVPSETALVGAAVFAPSGTPHWAGILGACAVGAVLGDHTSYAIGSRLRSRTDRWASRGGRRWSALESAARALDRRGGMLVLVGRFVPGGRTAVTAGAGLVGLPLRRFTPFAVLGGTLWAAYGTAIGYLGGAAFEREPLKAVALGLGLAFGLAAIGEAGRLLRARRRRATTSEPEPAGTTGAATTPHAAGGVTAAPETAGTLVG